MKKHFPNILLSKYIRGNIAMQIYLSAIAYTSNKGNNKITELRAILQRESQNS
jgi:hypothetical protein